MKRNRLRNPTNIRFSDPVRDRLDRISTIYNVPVSDLVRTAVNQKVPEWEREGVRLVAEPFHAQH